MDAAQLLRNKAEVTRLLILADLHQHPEASLSDTAGRLGVTVQAVSIHGKVLVGAGLVAREGRRFVLTPAGLQSLHEGARRLRVALDGMVPPASMIRVTSAVATTRIRKGDKVGLSMEEGDLCARPRAKASSTGRALDDAEEGGEVLVADLAGMVELAPGRLNVVALPSPAEGGIRRVDLPALRALLREAPRPAKVAALGTGALVLARRLGGVDLQFASDHAAFNAAERGLDVRLFVTRDRLPEAMRTFDALNATTLRRVPIELLHAPETKA